MENPNPLKFRSSDGYLLFANRAAFQKSPTVQNFLANTQNPDAEIPLESINGITMQLIIKWCEHHIDYPTVHYQHNGELPKPTEFDNQMMEESSSILTDLILGASFLELMGLVDVITQKVASNMHGMSSKEMMKYLCIPSDSDDEDEQGGARRRNAQAR